MGSQEASHGVVCSRGQILMHEVRTDRSEDDDASTM